MPSLADFPLEVSAFSSSDLSLFLNAMRILFINCNSLKCFYKQKFGEVMCLIATHLLFKNG